MARPLRKYLFCGFPKESDNFFPPHNFLNKWAILPNDNVFYDLIPALNQTVAIIRRLDVCKPELKTLKKIFSCTFKNVFSFGLSFSKITFTKFKLILIVLIMGSRKKNLNGWAIKALTPPPLGLMAVG